MAARLVSTAAIRVLSSNGLKAVLEELAPRLERAAGRRLSIRFAPAAELKVLIEQGEDFDLAILTSAAIDELIEQGRLAAPTRAIARSGVGVAIRKGAPQPDLSTARSFRRALLAATSIAYVGTGASGAAVRRVFERFGIAGEMQAKTRLLSGVCAADAVASGAAELGFTQVSEILGIEGAELAGPFPPEVQVHTVFRAAVGAGARAPAAARSLIEVLTAPPAARVIRARGMEPAW